MIGLTHNQIIRDHDSVDRSEEYTLAFVEFDDQGWFYDRSQMESLRKYLEEDCKGSRFLLTVFVHGWRHNAGSKDQNVSDFRNLLLRLARDENARHGSDRRRVVGIYVGWRGLSLRGPLLWEVLSFYGRKNAALHVSLGAVRELFAWLKHFKTQSNRDCGEAQSPTRLLLIGHSFGGLILFSAISQYVIESALNKDIVPPFGDLVVLINPAFEACRYYPVHCMIHDRKSFPPGQPPGLVIVTADTDTATKTWFPLGRRLGFSSWKARRIADQKTTVLNTVGHVPFMRTHLLTAKRDREPGPEIPTEGECARLIDEENKLYQEFNDEWRTQDRHLKPGWKRRFKGGAVLEHIYTGPAGTASPAETCDPENPYWVVSASKDVIYGHDGFWNKQVFVDFVRQLMEDACYRRVSKIPGRNVSQEAPLRAA
jgi:hypothetical protein